MTPAKMRTRKTSIRPGTFPTPRPREFSALVLAAGLGKRMRSRFPKVNHRLAGKAMVKHVVDAALETGAQRVVVVVGKDGAETKRAFGTDDPRIGFCTQNPPLGTGHAVLSAQRALRGVGGTLLILNGDVPALFPSTLRSLIEHHHRTAASMTILSTTLPDAGSYGRIIRNYSSDVSRIVEATDATPEEKKIGEINCGIYCVEMANLFRSLKQAGTHNAQKEIYLTDLVEILKRNNQRVGAYLHPDSEEVLGVNDRRELARAAKSLYLRKVEQLMDAGVTVIDPATTYVEPQVKVGRDTILHPMVFLQGNTVVGEECRIGPGTRIVDSVLKKRVEIMDHCVIRETKIANGAKVGPFAHLRPETELAEDAKIGNFVETKKSKIGRGSKANHLSYLGDAQIGARVNVGAGTITCNYDGEKKHKTVLEDGVFVGSDSQLVAPVRVRKGAYIGAGSTITKEVPPQSLALARGRQVVVKNWAKKRRGKRR